MLDGMIQNINPTVNQNVDLSEFDSITTSKKLTETVKANLLKIIANL